MWFLPFTEGMARRLGGPGSFRFILQPVVAVALGIRDGLLDAKAGEPAYLIGVLFHPERRTELLATAVRQLLTPFFVGAVLDLVLQYLIFQRIRLIPAAIVGLLLIGLPYAIARAITNRIATRWRQRHITQTTR